MGIRKRSWTKEQLQVAVKNSRSVRQVIKQLGLIPAGGNYSQITKYIREYGIDTAHFKGKGWSRGMKGIGTPRIPLKNIIIKGSTYQSYKLKNRLFREGIKEKNCEICGWAEVSKDGRLPLELDHINGNSTDNRLFNLRVLCPNCHSLQPTHRGSNRRNK